jgi:hypothetical protein
MAYLLRQRITKVSDLDDNSTWRYKLPTTGVYSALEMRINCDRYATRASGTVVYPLEACISKIEILAGGSRALLSVTGQQIDALNYWDFGVPTPRRYRQEASTGNDINLYLLGGRGLHDRQFGFDFDRLGECYLEYTYDLNEGTAEYFKANDHDVSLYGWRWMGPGAPGFQGYFRSRQLAAWTTTATSALKTIEIPTANPVRRIGIQAKTRTATLGGTFTEAEVRVNEGQYSPITIKSPMDWVMQEVVDYGLHNTIGGMDYVIGTGESDLPYWWSYIETANAVRGRARRGSHRGRRIEGSRALRSGRGSVLAYSTQVGAGDAPTFPAPPCSFREALQCYLSIRAVSTADTSTDYGPPPPMTIWSSRKSS